jgi:hypothetical protein
MMSRDPPSWQRQASLIAHALEMAPAFGSRYDIVGLDQMMRRDDEEPLPPPAPETRDDDWHLSHGYVLQDGVWVAEILARVEAARRDAIVQVVRAGKYLIRTDDDRRWSRRM